ncbi:hypothetical protein [Aliikangiella sp. G2MR2-5]
MFIHRDYRGKQYGVALSLLKQTLAYAQSNRVRQI